MWRERVDREVNITKVQPTSIFSPWFTKGAARKVAANKRLSVQTEIIAPVSVMTMKLVAELMSLYIYINTKEEAANSSKQIKQGFSYQKPQRNQF